MDLANRYIDEKLGAHWDIDKSPESFQRLLNHISSSTNFKTFFEKEIAHDGLFTPILDGMVVADIGAGVGWASSLLALKPEVKRVYAIEPSQMRLSKVLKVAKHFGVPEGKIIPVEGTFQKLNLPEKVHLACLSSSFHHCWDKDMPTLLENLKDILHDDINYRYKDYLNREINTIYRSKILLASEHYVTIMWTIKKIIAYFIKGRFMKDKNNEINTFGNWRKPDEFNSEHWRTKKEIINFMKKAKLDMKLFLHKGDQCNDKKWNILDRSIWKYYYAILTPNDS